ncbi:hypothetical protein PG985_014647 [Apiospora marii]|uniref:Uncharacterized protein n=1 Tax=Apiospora marii TaxID=335849 RepID=A0ABR1R4Q3_9PEZI
MNSKPLNPNGSHIVLFGHGGQQNNIAHANGADCARSGLVPKQTAIELIGEMYLGAGSEAKRRLRLSGLPGRSHAEVEYLIIQLIREEDDLSETDAPQAHSAAGQRNELQGRGKG